MGEATTKALVDLSNVDISIIGETIASLVPTVLALIVPIIAIRKGVSFVIGMVHGA